MRPPEHQHDPGCYMRNMARRQAFELARNPNPSILKQCSPRARSITWDDLSCGCGTAQNRGGNGEGARCKRAPEPCGLDRQQSAARCGRARRGATGELLTCAHGCRTACTGAVRVSFRHGAEWLSSMAGDCEQVREPFACPAGKLVCSSPGAMIAFSKASLLESPQ